MEEKIKALVSKAISDRVFPGAVVLVGDKNGILYQKAFGTTKYEDSGSVPVQTDFIYDIASLTKPFTATAILTLIDQGKITLDTKIGDIISGLEPIKKKTITIKELLTHNSGLSLKFHSLSDFPSKQIRHHLLTDPLIAKPGEKVLYDNANFMILAEVITYISGVKFVDYLQKSVLSPLNLKNTSFNPGTEKLSKIPPTEEDSWRTRLIHGEVHDESAFALGGIAGHAGLFSSAEDLWNFGRMWLADGDFEGKKILEASTVELATTPYVQEEKGSIGLCWKINNKNFASAPKGTYGHGGFTGTALVISPKRSKILVLLSNRVYPKRGPYELIEDVRSKLAEIVFANDA